jgi:hypothetical protein
VNDTFGKDGQEVIMGYPKVLVKGTVPWKD